MKRLSINEIIGLIENQQLVEAVAEDDSFEIKIHKYVPYCCLAIHDGGQIRKELIPKMALSEYERWYEEDRHTSDFISSLPITIVAKDSRYEYDLNRDPESCCEMVRWEKKVWSKNLSKLQMEHSKKKHSNFFKVVHALVAKLEELFEACLVYDVHSYNYRRIEEEAPLFNIGTENINRDKYGQYVDHWKKNLQKIKLPNIKNVVEENSVFKGRGYLLKNITENFSNTLVLATEIKKVYCNELTGEPYPVIIRGIQQQFKEAVLSNANFFAAEGTNWTEKNAYILLGKEEEPVIKHIDGQVHALLRNFELLAYVNPINVSSEREKFERTGLPPKFKYAPIRISPFDLKQQLSWIKIQEISDISIRHMYEAIINSYFDKIDMLASLDTPNFLYNSLRYFGRPGKQDISNAQYLLHLPSLPSEPESPPVSTADEVIVHFKNAIKSYGIEAKVSLSDKMVSKVMILNSTQEVLIRKDARFTQKQINSLIEHEIGIHLVTTMNSCQQNLNIFNLGLPVNTKTQEGLAVLMEYLSGNITLDRLRILGLRVVLVDMMCSGADFRECYDYLIVNQGINKRDAFTLATRVFRGGGFTKDYLYLSGLAEVLQMYNDGLDLTPLLVGKTSTKYYDIINEMIERGMIDRPRFITKSILKPNLDENHDLYEYIFSGLKPPVSSI